MALTPGSGPLTLDDIADLRSYEEEREDFRRRIIALKRRRRISVGPHVTFLFENRDTIRFQIQEMARVERLASDAQIQGELDVYNPLVPSGGRVCATMFVELVTEDQLREWLPKLVGIETTAEFRFGGFTVRCEVDPAHAAQLTREDVTAAVHYVRFSFTPEEIEAFGTAAVELALTHPAYTYSTPLGAETRAELAEDLND